MSRGSADLSAGGPDVTEVTEVVDLLDDTDESDQVRHLTIYGHIIKHPIIPSFIFIITDLYLEMFV